MAAGLKDFYQDVSGAAIAEKPAASSPALRNEPKLASSNGGTAQQTIDVGKQYEELLQSYKALNALLQEAQTGSGSAFGKIIEKYGFHPADIDVTITQPLRNAQGEEPENFGMKLIETQEDWFDINRDYQTALMYFPGIELVSVPTTTRGKKLAVVMGVTAREFNAVIAAERRKEKLAAEMQRLDRKMEKNRKDMGVDKMPRVPADNRKSPVATETPAQAKSEQKGLSLASNR